MSNRDVINQHKINALMTKEVRAVLKKYNFNPKYRSKVKIGNNYQAKIPEN